MRPADEDEFREYAMARMDSWRRSAYLLCQDWHTADDVVAVTVARLYRAWKRVREVENPDAYAQRTLTRAWLDERRRPWRRERSAAEPPDSSWLPPDRVVDRAALADALRTLGPRQRAVVVLRYYFDFSIDETADLLGMSTGSVKSHSSRGLDLLRAVVTDTRA